MRLRAARSVLSLASGGTMSSSVTGMPTLARCAAMPAPMMPAPMTAARLMSYDTGASLEPLDDGGDALAAADAEGGEAEPLVEHFQVVDEVGDEAAAAGAERVAQRDGAAVGIELTLVNAELADDGDALRGEGLVQLDHVNVRKLQAGAGQRLADGGDGADAHHLRADARDGRGEHARLGLDAPLLRLLRRDDDRGGGAVVERAAVAGGDGASLDERRLQLGERLHRGVAARALIDGEERAVGQRHGHDLALGDARVAGGERLLVAAQGEGVLLLAGDAVLPGQVLGGQAHGDVGLRPVLRALVGHAADLDAVSAADELRVVAGVEAAHR